MSKTARRGYLLAIVLLIVAAAVPASARTEIPVFVDGLKVEFDVQPMIQDGRVLVPFRLLGQALGVDVHWDAQARKVTANASGRQVELWDQSLTAYVDSTPAVLDVPVRIINGRTLVPLRFFSEALGCQVQWEQASRTIRVQSQPSAMKVFGFYALGDAQTSSWTNLFAAPYPNHHAGNTNLISDLALGWYTLDEQGNILTASNRTAWRRPSGWEDVLHTAAYYRLATEMVIHETNKENLLSKLLESEPAMDRAVAQILHEVTFFGGVNLNLESLGRSQTGSELAETQRKFTHFVEKLAAPLHHAGKTLTLTIHPPNSAFKGYNYRDLALHADRIIIMAYDYGSRPEPVNRVVQAVEMALANVPPEKLILGISVPSETAESIGIKVAIARRYGLDGIALWRLGLLTDDMWSALRSTITAKSAVP